MRVLLLNDRIPPESRGGAGRALWNLALGLRAAGQDVHVIAATSDAAFQEEREGIPTYHVHSRYPGRWRAWLSLVNPQTIPHLRTLYQRIQPDVVNAHNIHYDLSYHSLTLAYRMGFPTVFTSHDVMPFAYHKLSFFIDKARCGVQSAADYRLPPFFNLRQNRLRYNPLRNWRIRQVLARHVQVRTAPSQELCNAHQANGLPPFTCVHNGIDPHRLQVTPETIDALRTRLGLHGRKVLLFAGRLSGAKGTVQLLDALQLVVQHVPEALLLVLSSVPVEQQIQQERYVALRDQHIRTGGWLAGDDLAAAFHAAHVVAVPSIIFDTFPTVNLEGMAAKSAVVASCYGGSREAVVDGETGYIVNPFDTAEFAQKLVRVLRDDALRERMGAAGYERVRQYFTLEQQAARMMRLYEQAVHSIRHLP